MKIHIETTIEVSDDFMSGVLITAFDGDYGGCWYWARPYQPGPISWLGVDAGNHDIWKSVWIQEKEASSDATGIRKFHIDYQVIAAGIAFALDSRSTVGETIRRMIQTAVFDNDAGMIDAEAADAIIQLATFGELVYG